MRRQRSINDTVAWLHAAGDAGDIAGAAFLVSPNLALTCAHVVRDHLGLEKPAPRQLPTGTIRLQFQGLRTEVNARVAPSGWWPGGEDDEIEDVAVLELASPLEDIRFAALAAFLPSDQHDVEIFGASGGYQTVGQTVFAQLAAKPDWRGWRQLDARPGQQSSYFPVQGFSGSPVLDSLGNIIWGMVVAVETASDKLVGFAISADDLRAVTDAVLKAARARDEMLNPPAEQAPGPQDELARETLASLLDEESEPERAEMLRGAMRELAERARDTSEESRIEHALTQLRAGEKSEAEKLFAEMIARRKAEGAAAYRDAAEAARHLGAIAYLDNTTKAIEAYRTATELDPDDTWSWIYLGRLYQRAGKLAAAEQAFRQARAVAARAGDERDVAVAHHDLGTVHEARGSLEEALQAYTEYHDAAQRLTASDPGNAGWQRDLAISYGRIALIDARQGERERALAAFREGRAVIARLREASPDHAILASDLAWFDAEIAKLSG
jgi:tetratricopeptide (TPR) repeat protein